MTVRAWSIPMPKGDRLVLLRGSDFDWLVSEARKRTVSIQRELSAPRLSDFPPAVEDHIDTEEIIQ